MQKVKKLIITAIMLLGCITTAYATAPTVESQKPIEINTATDVPVALTAEAMKFSVTVPISLPVTVDKDGVVTYANNAKIVNNSAGPVQVKNVEISGQNHWSVIDWDTYNTATEKVNSMRVAFRFGTNGTDYDKTTGTNTMSFTQSYWPHIAAQNDSNTEELPIKYEAKVAAQNRVHDATEMAQVVFTVGWYTV